MMNLRTIVFGTTITAIGAIAVAQHAPSGNPGRVDSRRALGAPHAYRNLTLIPVLDSSARATDSFVTLDEGLKTGRVSVKESPGGGQVNTLYVTNRSAKPLYLMAGEVVLGGQQDRCLGRDIIVPPKKRLQPVTVFCVEHGRWTGRQEFAESAKTVASAGIRLSAQDGAFKAAQAAIPARVATVNGAGGGRGGAPATQQPQEVSVGYAAVSKSQGEVWDKVAQKNRRFKAESESGTYRNILNQSAGSAGRSINPYVKELANATASNPHVVGMVAAVNGKVVAADIFGDPALFRKLWPKLLRSYAADAAENADGKRSPPVTATEARAFLRQASDAKVRAENHSDVSSTLRLESSDALSYRLMPAKAGGFGGGGLGGSTPLHESVLRK